jgi:hypothetical protein
MSCFVCRVIDDAGILELLYEFDGEVDQLLGKYYFFLLYIINTIVVVIYL